MAMVDPHSLSDHINALQLENSSDIDSIIHSRLAMKTMKDNRMSSLSLACHMGNVHLVTTLLEQGVDVNAQEKDGMSPLHILCSREDNPYARLQIAETLLKHNVDVNQVDSCGSTALLYACCNNLVDVIQCLINADCDINIPNKAGNTPFSVTCRLASEGWYFWNADALNGGDEEGYCPGGDDFPPAVIGKALLRAGADHKLATLLPTAVLFSTMSVVKDFIDLGMDVNVMDENRRSPLGCACAASHIPSSMVKLLLENGADANEAIEGRKSKPIISAYVHNSVEKIRLLLSYGAKISCEEMSELVSISLSKWFLENPDVIHEESKELLSWKLLIKAGFRPKMHVLDMKLKQVSLCSSYPQVSPWIYNMLFPLSTLSDCSRIIVRSKLPPSVDENIEHLPLPNSLKGFLKFNEFSIAVPPSCAV